MVCTYTFQTYVSNRLILKILLNLNFILEIMIRQETIRVRRKRIVRRVTEFDWQYRDRTIRVIRVYPFTRDGLLLEVRLDEVVSRSETISTLPLSHRETFLNSLVVRHR